MLTLCATPIGNLSDITIRSLDILKAADLILCEDTRVTIKLLNHYNITTKLESYHEHNKFAKTTAIIERLQSGQNIALVTDAGTPGISDPGEDLVKACIDAGIEVTSTPGPVAFIVALILSGKSTRRFIFEGFLPTNKKEKLAILQSLANESRTIILYESPHRIEKTLNSILDILGNRNITLAKELTKKFETLIHTTIIDAISMFQAMIPRGEFVLIIQGKDIDLIRQEQIQNWQQISIIEHMDIYLKQGLAEKFAMKKVAIDRGISKRDIYNQIKILDK